MRHYSQAHIDLAGKTVSVVGKGPSYAQEKVFSALLDGHYLCSINNAWVATDIAFDMCIFIDWHCSKHFKNCELVDTFITTTWAVKEDDSVLSLAFKTLEGFHDRLFFFDTKKAHRFKDQPRVPLSVSTTEAAVWLLANLGAKKINFIGVDGTMDHHPLFEKRVSKVNLENQFIKLAQMEKDFNLSYTGLPNVYKIYKEKIQ